MTRASFAALLVIAALYVLVSAGPTLVGLAEALVPLVLVVGLVVAVLRVVWHFTTWR